MSFWFNGTIEEYSANSRPILVLKQGSSVILDLRRQGNGLLVQTNNASGSMTIANIFTGFVAEGGDTFFGFSVGSLGNML